MKTKLLALAVAAALAACGGSDNPTAPVVPVVQAPVAVVVSGTAATGGAFAGATVNIIDKTGTVIGTTTTAADGSFTITLPLGATGPFVLQAVRDDITLTSIAADTSSTTLNITPITTLIASRLSVSGDPSKLVAELQANPALLSAANVTARVAEIVALIQPLLDAVGTTANPLTGAFSANGTGIDRALDSLSITITPSSTTSTNIQIAIKQITTGGEQPATINFTNTTASIQPLPAIAPASLVSSGTAPLIADLMTRITACFALPVSDRVNVPDAPMAVAADIKAPACKTIFDGNDPANFKSNGNVVGVGPNTAFNGIYRTGATNLVFDRGSYLFSRSNGDLVVGYRTTDSKGNVSYNDIAARLSSVDSKLHLIGNQYNYGGGIVPYQQLREFFNQPAATYYSTGYDIRIPSNTSLAQVVVTSPKGNSTTMVNGSGSSNMVIQKAGAPSGTSYLRFRSEYADPATTSDPGLSDLGPVFLSPRIADADIATLPSQSTWKFEYYLVGNTTSTPDAIQYYKTVGRALTIAELKNQPLANLTDSDVAGLKTSTNVNNVIPVGGNSNIQLDWTVPTGALSPTSIKVFGKSGTINPKPAFDDSTSVGSTARTGKIFCSTQSTNDFHCSTTNGVTTYASSSFLTGLHLFASDPTLHEFTHFYAPYKITIQ